MAKRALSGLIAVAVLSLLPWPAAAAAGLDQIQNVVVIYAENRSFDSLYGAFPGARAWPTRARRA